VPRRPQKDAAADLNQIRVLADPLRLRILGAMAREPRTTKQVAELLGENHTRLYHHVQAMERVKLIRLVETRAKRGTVEKYYQAAAARFDAGISTFSGAASTEEKLASLQALINAILDATRRDVLLHVQPGGPVQTEQGSLLATRLVYRGSPKRAQAIQRRIGRLLEQLKKLPPAAGKSAKPVRCWALNIIFCPTDDT